MPLVFACIAPHGAIAIPEAKPKDKPGLATATTAGMQELGRRFTAAEPDVSIVLTPHNIHVEGARAVIHAAAVSATWCGGEAPSRCASPSTASSRCRSATRSAGRGSQSWR
jgi:aromatic ring-opening dioxygenase LigB subunit